MAPVPPNHVVGQGCECGCLMRRLDSVEVFNSMQEPVHVTVVCENRYGQEMEDQLIMPGESYHFQKKIIQRANARPIIAPVQSVSVMHSLGEHTLTPVVNNFVVRKLEVHIELDGKMVQGTEHC